MARQVNLRCRHCARRFGGDEGLRKHRKLAGDKLVCKSDAELFEQGWTRDLAYVWHRPVGATAKPSALVRPPSEPSSTLFDTAPPTRPQRLARASDPETSHIAARAIAPRTGTLKAIILDAYRAEPEGLTDAEVAARTGLDLGTQVTKRCADLRNEGLIAVVGRRPGRAGTPVRVCAIAEQASA